MNAVRIALRALARSPGYTAAAILTLALGIGASTAMFSLLHGSLLRPLPYRAPADLVSFRDSYEPTNATGSMQTVNFVELQQQVQNAELAAYTGISVNATTGDRPERLPGVRATANFLRTLGVTPERGRGFVEGEDLDGRPDVVVISWRLWQDRFDGRSDVLGQTIALDGVPHTVVGVLPADFWFPNDPQLLVPFAFTPEQLAAEDSRWLQGIARMTPGTTLPQLHAELNTVFAGIRERRPGSNTGWSVQTSAFAEWALGTSRTTLLLVNGAVLLLLLIAAVNVANLMLVRAERRSREIAMRVALGAGRARIAAQYLGEALLLAVLGAAGGVVVAALASRALLALFGSGLPRASTVSLSLPVLAFAVLISLLVGLLIGLVPVIRTNTRDIYDTLREAGRGGSQRGNRLQQALVATEVALAVLLVSGAALLVHSFWRLNAVDTGMQVDNALVFSVQLPLGDYPTREETASFYNRSLERIHAVPGVRSAGVSELTPLQGGRNITTLPSPLDPEITASFVELRSITPGFFAAAGIPILSGRGLDEHDLRDERRAVVINDELARTLFGDVDPIGYTMFDSGSGGFEVVGVAGSIREFGITGDKRPGAYFPLQMTGRANSMVYVIRTAGSPMDVVPGIRAAVAEIDPALPIYGVQTMREVVTQTMGARWLATNLFAAFGAIALFLAAFGVFGVLAYVVEQRTRDIGIRMALGATSGRVRAMVVMQGLKLAAVGLVIGLTAAMFGSSLIADLLWEVEPTDWRTLSVAAAVALTTASLAALLPAIRATRIEPGVALMRD